MASKPGEQESISWSNGRHPPALALRKYLLNDGYMSRIEVARNYTDELVLFHLSSRSRFKYQKATNAGSPLISVMHYCKNCLQQVEDDVSFCPTCGAKQPIETPRQLNLSPQEHPIPAPSEVTPPFEKRGEKNPWIAAALNFFLPGTGYMYAGANRDKSMVVFGGLIFLAIFVGLYIPIFGSPASSAPSTIPQIDLLETLIFILPFAFAFDGYARTSKMNRSSGRE